MIVKSPGPQNNIPIAQDDTAETSPNVAIEIDALANDSDPDGDTINFSGTLMNQTNGTFIIVNNKVTFTPDQDFIGDATAVYTITDSK